MRIVAKFPFGCSEEYFPAHYPHLCKEIGEIVSLVDSQSCKTKSSKEKTMPGKVLFSPRKLNEAFSEEFRKCGWKKQKVSCEYSTKHYVEGYGAPHTVRGAFREMDFLKEHLGVEVQFGKYAFMVYNVAAKMTIFRKLGFIDAGVEIVPVKEFADEMSTGVSYFEQFVWDLTARGVSNIDIPVLILGVCS